MQNTRLRTCPDNRALSVVTLLGLKIGIAARAVSRPPARRATWHGTHGFALEPLNITGIGRIRVRNVQGLAKSRSSIA